MWCLSKNWAFVTFRGPSHYRGKNLLNAQAKRWVYATTWQRYTPNVKCRTRKKQKTKKTNIFTYFSVYYSCLNCTLYFIQAGLPLLRYMYIVFLTRMYLTGHYKLSMYIISFVQSYPQCITSQTVISASPSNIYMKLLTHLLGCCLWWFLLLFCYFLAWFGDSLYRKEKKQ